MALQLFKIQSIEVASPVASVTFSSIPQGYTDLKLEVSAKCNRPNEYQSLFLQPNGSSLNGTSRILEGNGTAASSNTSPYIIIQNLQGNVATQANVFGSASAYIPNYTSNVYKSFSIDSTGENNATTAYADLGASLWSSTAAITSLTVETTNPLYSIMPLSTFTLYGVL